MNASSPSDRRWLTHAASLALGHGCAAWWSNISDCDEVFNYWEPLHFMTYGTGENRCVSCVRASTHSVHW